jgi:hypothetical protein
MRIPNRKCYMHLLLRNGEGACRGTVLEIFQSCSKPFTYFLKVCFNIVPLLHIWMHQTGWPTNRFYAFLLTQPEVHLHRQRTPPTSVSASFVLLQLPRPCVTMVAFILILACTTLSLSLCLHLHSIGTYASPRGPPPHSHAFGTKRVFVYLMTLWLVPV